MNHKSSVNWISNKDSNNNIVNELMTIPLKTNQFTNGGVNVKLLENFIKTKLNIDDSKSVVVVTNGSVALHSIISGIEYYEKTKINWATQSFTFPPSLFFYIKYYYYLILLFYITRVTIRCFSD